MDKKTVIIFASPKSNSYTEKLLLKIYGPTDRAFVYNCFKAMPHPCTDCGLCKKENKCGFSDLDNFFTVFEKCERVIFAFPVYNNGLPAPLKALVDRFQRFYNARFILGERPPIKGKRKADILLTCGSDEDPTDIILKQLKPMFTISGCVLNKCFLLNNTDKTDLSSLNPKEIL